MKQREKRSLWTFLFFSLTKNMVLILRQEKFFPDEKLGFLIGY